MILTFGKHRGKDVRDVEKSYLRWIINDCETASAKLKKACDLVLSGDDLDSLDDDDSDLEEVVSRPAKPVMKSKTFARIADKPKAPTKPYKGIDELAKKAAKPVPAPVVVEVRDHGTCLSCGVTGFICKGRCTVCGSSPIGDKLAEMAANITKAIAAWREWQDDTPEVRAVADSLVKTIESTLASELTRL